MPPPRRKRVTIADVARLSNVTPATVSRVLNGKAKFSASDGVRSRIIAVAEELGYAPDLSARNLSSGRTQIVGLFGSPQMQLAEGITDGLVEGISACMESNGYDVFLEMSVLNHRAPPWRFDGAILMQSPRAELVADFDRRGIPYVCVNDRVGDAVACVLADDAVGTVLAVDHLYQLGHRHIAYANARPTYFLNHYSVAERLRTLETATEARRMTLSPVSHGYFEDADRFIDQAVLQDRCTAVLCYDHRIAVDVIGAAGTRGLSIPADVSLICFNDVFPMAQLNPPVTTIAVDGPKIGRAGAAFLLEHLRQAAGSPLGQELRIAERLVVRQSTASAKTRRRTGSRRVHNPHGSTD